MIKMRKQILDEKRKKRDKQIVKDYIELSQKYEISNVADVLANKYKRTVQRIYQILNENGISLKNNE